MNRSNEPQHTSCDLLQGLTPAQREAVCHVEGPLLILAGPGSGKTRVITHRIAYLIRSGIPPSQVLALTFTNKAADEMRSRVQALVPQGRVWMGTYHRFCAQLLRKYGGMIGLQPNFTIYDAEQSRALLRRLLARQKLRDPHLTTETVAAAIGWAKNHLISAEQYQPASGHPFGGVVAQLYRAYQEELLRCNAADFDDLLLHVVFLLRENPELRSDLDQQYRFVLVDEYQDTNLAQYAIARALSIDYPNLAVTGDPDQSIYGWRGANLRNILEFEKDFPRVRVIRLEQNYRSTKRILRVAAQLIAHNVKRKQKDLFTENGEGVPVRLTTYPTQHEEAQAIAEHIAEAVGSGRRRARDFAIFYRVNALSRTFELALRERGIAFQLINGIEFFQRKEIRDVVAYLQLLSNPSDEMALLRAIANPPRGIGKKTIERLTECAIARGISMLEAIRNCEQLGRFSPRITKQLKRFAACFKRLSEVVFAPVEEIVGHVLEVSGYRELLAQSQVPEDQDRLANLEELLTVARQFDERSGSQGGLDAFLEEISLVGETDDWDTTDDRVTLMTLHASKGLEFPVVFLVAVEQGILPHERSREHADQLEEERRLMFVGITRAQEELYISHAEYRDFRGRRRLTIPSQFLMELPRNEMEVMRCGSPSPAAEKTYYELPVPEGASRSVRRRTAGVAQLTTAARLAGEASESVDPEQFHQGMLVLHGELGLGRIVALSGQGAARTATVRFLSNGCEKKFVLAAGKLQPLSRNGDA